MWSRFLAVFLVTIAVNPLGIGANPAIAEECPYLSAPSARMTVFAGDAVANILKTLGIETTEDLGFLYSSEDEAREAGNRADIPSLAALWRISRSTSANSGLAAAKRFLASLTPAPAAATAPQPIPPPKVIKAQIYVEGAHM